MLFLFLLFLIRSLGPLCRRVGRFLVEYIFSLRNKKKDSILDFFDNSTIYPQVECANLNQELQDLEVRIRRGQKKAPEDAYQVIQVYLYNCTADFFN